MLHMRMHTRNNACTGRTRPKVSLSAKMHVQQYEMCERQRGAVDWHRDRNKEGQHTPETVPPAGRPAAPACKVVLRQPQLLAQWLLRSCIQQAQRSRHSRPTATAASVALVQQAPAAAAAPGAAVLGEDPAEQSHSSNDGQAADDRRQRHRHGVGAGVAAGGQRAQGALVLVEVLVSGGGGDLQGMGQGSAGEGGTLIVCCTGPLVH